MNCLRPAIMGLLAALALWPAAPAQAQDATGQIAFVSDRDGNSEIYVMNADGSGQTNLTNNPANDSAPDWSPNGSKIAFTRGPFDSSDIYVMDANGSNQTNLTDNPASDFGPVWSPDGSRVAFTSDRDGNSEIYVMNADGSGQTNVTNNPVFDLDPAWSPDGSRIVYTSDRDDPFASILVVNADGSGQTILTDDARVVAAPAWSPDGSRIAFTSDRGGSLGGIFAMNADGSDLIPLAATANPLAEFGPAWSPDSSRIAFIEVTVESPFFSGVLSEIYLMNADGSSQTNLTDNPANDTEPTWSPDGNRIAFTSGRDDPNRPGCLLSGCNSEIYVMNADGSGQTRLTNDPAADSDPAWSPQAIAEPTPEPAAPSATGKIAFVSDRDGNSEIYVMNADGSGQTNVTNNPADDSEPTWYHDGSRIAFVSRRDGNDEIYVMNADGSGLINLTDNPGIDGSPAWSPEASRIAFAADRDGNDIPSIYVMNADGSGQTRLTDNSAATSGDNPSLVANDFDPAWSPEGSRIAFSSTLGLGVVISIYVMNADGSNRINLTDPLAEASEPAWSPDGSRIAFGGSEGVYLMNADGSGQTRLTDSTDRSPAWSPDGSRIAFHSERDGNREIYVMNADGSGQTRLTDNPANDFDPVWSPEPPPEPVQPAIESTGAPQTAFVESVPGPDEISTDPEVIGSNIALTLFVIFTFAFTSALFNQTLSYNRREIEGWVGRFFAPFRRFSGVVEQRYGAVAERRSWVQRVAGPAVILLLTGLIYGFLSPDFGINAKSAVLFISMVVGVGGVTYVYAGGEALFTRRRFGLRAGVKLYAVALAIAVGSVLVSRLMDFQPGFLFGFVASYTLLATGALDRRQQGQTVLFAAIALLALSLIAWFLVIPLRDARQDSSVWWLALPEGTVVAVFVAGLQGVFFSMVPLSFMDGAKIAQWSRLLWLLLFGAAAFLFWHVLLNQEGAFLKALEQRRVVAALVLLSLYSIITLFTWLYFRGRVYGWSLPSLLRRQAAPGGAASESGTVSTAQPTLRKSVPMPVFLATVALAGAAIIAITVLAFALRGDGAAESRPVVVVAGTPTVVALSSPTPPVPTTAPTPASVAIDRAADCDAASSSPELAQELATIRDQGYVVCDTRTYLPGGALHVLIGVLEDSEDSFTQLAFVFVGGEYLGTDSISPSASITVVSQTANTLTLSYAMYRPDDQMCCPSAGEAIVPYDWDGTTFAPRVDIPPTDGPISRR